jgi:hypothetical protein
MCVPYGALPYFLKLIFLNFIIFYIPLYYFLRLRSFYPSFSNGIGKFLFWGGGFFFIHLNNLFTLTQVTIAEVEEIVEIGEIPPDHVHVPSIYVQKVIKGKLRAF